MSISRLILCQRFTSKRVLYRCVEISQDLDVGSQNVCYRNWISNIKPLQEDEHNELSQKMCSVVSSYSKQTL